MRTWDPSIEDDATVKAGSGETITFIKTDYNLFKVALQLKKAGYTVRFISSLEAQALTREENGLIVQIDRKRRDLMDSGIVLAIATLATVGIIPSVTEYGFDFTIKMPLEGKTFALHQKEWKWYGIFPALLSFVLPWTVDTNFAVDDETIGILVRLIARYAKTVHV